MSALPAAPRCVLFVDGANLYHYTKQLRINPQQVDIEKLAQKLVEGRQLLQIRYYIPELDRTAGKAYEANQQLLTDLSQRSVVHVSRGYIQRTWEESSCADETLGISGQSANQATTAGLRTTG